MARYKNPYGGDQIRNAFSGLSRAILGDANTSNAADKRMVAEARARELAAQEEYNRQRAVNESLKNDDFRRRSALAEAMAGNPAIIGQVRQAIGDVAQPDTRGVDLDGSVVVTPGSAPQYSDADVGSLAQMLLDPMSRPDFNANSLNMINELYGNRRAADAIFGGDADAIRRGAIFRGMNIDEDFAPTGSVADVIRKEMLDNERYAVDSQERVGMAEVDRKAEADKLLNDRSLTTAQDEIESTERIENRKIDVKDATARLKIAETTKLDRRGQDLEKEVGMDRNQKTLDASKYKADSDYRAKEYATDIAFKTAKAQTAANAKAASDETQRKRDNDEERLKLDREIRKTEQDNWLSVNEAKNSDWFMARMEEIASNERVNQQKNDAKTITQARVKLGSKEYQEAVDLAMQLTEDRLKDKNDARLPVSFTREIFAESLKAYQNNPQGFGGIGDAVVQMFEQYYSGEGYYQRNYVADSVYIPPIIMTSIKNAIMNRGMTIDQYLQHPQGAVMKYGFREDHIREAIEETFPNAK